MFAVTLLSGDTIYLVPENVLSVRSNGSGAAIAYVEKELTYYVSESASDVNTLIEDAIASSNNTPTDSVSNNTTTPLNASATWTGTAELSNRSDIFVTAETDQSGTLSVQASQDGTNWTTIGSYKYRAGASTNRPHKFIIAKRYFRVSFENTSASNQTYLRIKTYLGEFGDLTVPFNGTIARDADTSVVIPVDYSLVLSEGKVDGYGNYDTFGFDDDLDTGDGTVALWSAKVAFTPMAAAGTLDVVSSSANDADGGTGARTILIQGVDANGEVSETLTMTGITPAVTVNNYTGVNKVTVATAGSSQANEGSITITATTGGSTQAYISIGTSITQQLIFHVPSDKDAYIKGFIFDAAQTSGGATPRISITAYKLYSGVKYTFFSGIIDTSASTEIVTDLPNYIKIEAGAIWWVDVSTSVNEAFIRGRVFQTLVDR